MTDTEDEIVWEEAVKGVKRLPKSGTTESRPKLKPSTIKKDTTVLLKPMKRNLQLGSASDIDKNTMRRFKREEFAIEARLDLHGFTEDKAYEAFKNFIISSYMSAKRCVLIITGKGLKHIDEDVFATKGVLKMSVPQWLNRPELSQLILSYIHPSERLGGSGALYILLRRNRG